MGTLTIIAPQTGAVAAKTPYRIPAGEAQVFMVGGAIDSAVLAGAEEVDFYYSINDRTSWHVLNDRDGNPVKFTSTVGLALIEGPLLIAVTKDATAAAVGVFVEVES